MSSKENFNQAMFEMFGIGKDPNEKKSEAEAPKAESKKEAKAEAKKAEPKKEAAPATPAKVTYQKTVLGEGTYFEGTLTSKGDVEIAGVFKGDIVSDGDVVLHSKIDGNIKAKNLNVISNTVNGNVVVEGKVTIAVGSEIKGNITAQSIVCSGKVLGDMVISGDASFDELSYVEGNISTRYITINHGAYIDGKLAIIK